MIVPDSAENSFLSATIKLLPHVETVATTTFGVAPIERFQRVLSLAFVPHKAVNREDKRSRRYRGRDFAKFERSRRYRDR